MLKRMLAVGALCVAGSGAAATDGNTLLESCKSSSEAQRAFCAGFIAGSLESWNEAAEAAAATAEILKNMNRPVDFERITEAVKFCWPQNAPPNLIIEAVKMSLEDKPHERHLQASQLAVVAVMQAFPCPN